MYRLNLNRSKNYQRTGLRRLIKNWNDGSLTGVPLIIVKISEAFSMYHQVSSFTESVYRRAFKNLHPVLMNDLDTDLNIVIVMDSSGQILHYALVSDRGQLRLHDSLRRVAHRKVSQKYLDYFYCITKNIEDYFRSTTRHKDS